MHASYVMDFKFLLEKILSIEYEIFGDVKLIDDELTKINSSWCETVHSDMRHSDCYFHIVKGEDEGYNYLAERMGLFTQKKPHYLTYIPNSKTLWTFWLKKTII